MSATRFTKASKRVVLYCQPTCGNSIEIAGTASVTTARRVARREHGWDCPANSNRAARDRCPTCPGRFEL